MGTAGMSLSTKRYAENVRTEYKALALDIGGEEKECMIITCSYPEFDYIFERRFWEKLSKAKKSLFLNPKGAKT